MEHELDPDVLRIELRYYIDNASNQELQELYDFVNSKTPPYEWWNDEELMAELDRRTADLKSGKDPGISWDVLKKDLLSRRNTDTI
jgi:putative addiction module component (TIGR02574 family)